MLDQNVGKDSYIIACKFQYAILLRDGAVVACETHNLKVSRSNRLPATSNFIQIRDINKVKRLYKLSENLQINGEWQVEYLSIVQLKTH